MNSRALVGILVVAVSGILFMMAPASFAAPHPIDNTAAEIDPFGEKVGIGLSSDSHKKKHPAPGKPGGGGGEPDPPGQDQDRVDVCHKGKTKSIDPSKVGDHLGHGDTLGECQ